ncbi:hypothetical protein PV682_40725 [Streptomyces niveiscabiei]|nr:hypothetical protein [Streptomyces niveiscabiei]MDX3387726.1 hypothetical protein [Streptomyces niveiscabiei]
MNLKKIVGAAAGVVMLAGLGTVATATNASASSPTPPAAMTPASRSSSRS